MISEEINDLQKRLTEFLELGGAEILLTTNPYEIVRFRTVNGVSVIYRNKKGSLSYSNDHAKLAATKFLDGKGWTASKLYKITTRKSVEEKLIERDGYNCFYCNESFAKSEPTLEHMLSITHGGNNNIANLALSCESCNTKAGQPPIVEKIKLRNQMREKS